MHAQALASVTERDARGRCMNRRDPKRQKAVFRLARAKGRESNARRDYAHKVALDLVRRYDVIALEELRMKNMTRSAKGTADEPGKNVAAKSGLNRSLLDAGFGILATLIREKAEYAAREVIFVDPKFTSQTCFACKHVSKESRDRERFVCVRCGYDADADVNAARNILARAINGGVAADEWVSAGVAPRLTSPRAA